MTRQPVVIIGSGLAGYTVAREFRKLDTATPLVILSADHGGFYSKPMLSNAFASNRTPEALVNADAARMAEQLDARIRPRTEVAAIDPGAKSLALADGEELPYHRLVLALGADPIRLPLSGDGSDAPQPVNDLEDYARFRQALEGARQVAILGAGLIGCEFANDLAGAGYLVSVIDPAPYPLGRLLPPEAAGMLKSRLAAAGVEWHLGTHVAAIDRVGSGLRLTLANGDTLGADAVLSAVGLRPRTALAAAAGLETHRGITVDRRLRTSVEDIYAIGDCAEVEGRVLPFVLPIMHAARALASTLADRPTPVRYPAMPVVVKTPACPVVVAPPDPATPGAWRVWEGADGVKALYSDEGGNLLGFALAGAATAEKNALAGRLPAVMDIEKSGEP